MDLSQPSSTKNLNSIQGKDALVDGDILVYRCAFVAEKNHYQVAGYEFDNHKDAKNFAASTQEEWDTRAMGGTAHIWTRKELQPVEFALEALKTTVLSLQEKLYPRRMEIYLSGKRNFRDDIAVTKPYKGNRDNQPKPTYWRDCREYLIDNWGAIVTDGIEADDALGIAQCSRSAGSSVIVTNDKDLGQIPGWHFDWTNDNVYKVSKRAAAFSFYSQILSGDPTDNVPGLGGIGPAKAAAILDGAKSEKDLFSRTWDAYRARGPGKSDDDNRRYMIEQASLVYILRSVDDSYKPYSLPEV